MPPSYNESYRLLIVDCDGNILYDLEWDQDHYTVQERLREAPQPLAAVPSTLPQSEKSNAVAPTVELPSDPHLQAILHDLRDTFDGTIEQAVVVDASGKALSALSHHQVELFGAMLTLLAQFAEQLTAQLDGGQLGEILLREAARLIVLYPVNNLAILGVVVPAESNIGMLHWACRDILQRLEEALTH